jgi:hypothetical protein
MNINNLNIWQIPQNAVNTVELVTTSPLNGGGSSTAHPATVSSVGETTAPQVQPESIAAGISYLKEQLDDILKSYPPFFPAGTYQRADLITKIRSIQDEIQKYSVASTGSTQMNVAEKLPVDSPDREITTALNGLFEFRDALTQDGSISPENTQPGLILNTMA